MKKGAAILLLGLLLGVAGFSGIYFFGTSSCREMMREPQPELAWLKSEFHISEGEFDRVQELHRTYLRECEERCRRIDEVNAELKRALAAANAVTPAIEATLARAARLRAECQAKMLQHFYEVSRTMPPEEAQRYLVWVQEKTIPPSHATMTGHH